jgi:GrpB-like predicted nucleotidyltransferase (UPF0157 family)
VSGEGGAPGHGGPPPAAPQPDEALEERVRRAVAETIAIVPYDARWPVLFELEKAHLLASLPADLISRVEHIGSTSVPGLASKDVVDVLVEVTDQAAAQKRIVPILRSQGYEYFWRPLIGDHGPPYYAWFIKRDPSAGSRTHHIHVVPADSDEPRKCLLFRDHLMAHPEAAREYEALKRALAARFLGDRAKYTEEKTAFITAVTAAALASYDERRDVEQGR